MIETFALIAIFIAFFYFLAIRPMQRQAKAATEMRSQLEIGSRVMLASGLYGTVKHLADRQAIIELAPGLEVTVIKTAISSIVKPEDEDFEYEDENPGEDDAMLPADEVVVEEVVVTEEPAAGAVPTAQPLDDQTDPQAQNVAPDTARGH